MSRRNPFLTAAALIALVLPIGLKGQDKENCSNTTLHGSYGLHATGTIVGVGDFAAVGRFTFDGKGNLAGTLFERVNSNNSQVRIKGAYVVSPDCTVSDVWYISDGSTTTHESVIVKEGQGYFVLNNTSGAPRL
jgi:hypothetical protein